MAQETSLVIDRGTCPELRLAPDDERARNARLNAREYAEQKIVLESLPTLLIVELTQNCNLACVMCRPAMRYDPSRNMSPEVFERALWLFRYAAIADLRGWGESTILRHFPVWVRKAVDTSVRLRLITNALAMTPALWELLCSGPNIVGVSLDSADPGVFARLGRGDLQRVIANLRRGVLERDRCRQAEIYLNTIVSSETIDGLSAIVTLAADLGIERVVMSPVSCAPENRLHLQHVRNSIRGVLDAAERTAIALGVELQLGAAFDTSLVVEKGLLPVCPNPWSNALIDYRGRVGFCHHLIGHPELTMGNIAERPFTEIWNSGQFQRLRAEHLRARDARAVEPPFSKCSWCYRNRYTDVEDIVMPAMGARRVVAGGTVPLMPPIAEATPSGALANPNVGHFKILTGT